MRSLSAIMNLAAKIPAVEELPYLERVRTWRAGDSWVQAAETRLAKMLELPVGWDGHCGRAMDPQIGHLVKAFIALLASKSVPIPSITPLSSGGAQIEWHRNSWDIEIEFDLDSTVVMTRNLDKNLESLHDVDSYGEIFDIIQPLLR